jgi:hypothetical protein
MLGLHLATITTMSPIPEHRGERNRAWSRIGVIVGERNGRGWIGDIVGIGTDFKSNLNFTTIAPIHFLIVTERGLRNKT